MARWGVFSSTTLATGARRLEASAYLSDGYGLREALAASGAKLLPLSELAAINLPGRLKGIEVDKAVGTPFISASQVFQDRPTPRKWLATRRTPNYDELFAPRGTILVSRSGNVGRVIAANVKHDGMLLTDDLFRVTPHREAARGWIYAFLSSPLTRSMMVSAQYGHIVKHLQPSHLGDLLVPVRSDADLHRYGQGFEEALAYRDAAHQRLLAAERILLNNLPSLGATSGRTFTLKSLAFDSGRRRLDGAFHAPEPRAIVAAMHRDADSVMKLRDVTDRVWWMSRYKRTFRSDGMPYASADDLFSVGSKGRKRVLMPKDRAETYKAKPGWIVMACSGQTYGLLGASILIQSEQSDLVLTHDLLRITPRFAEIRPAYLAAFLGHPRLGRVLATRYAYGTSVPHLDPSDIAEMPIPRFNDRVENDVANLFEESARLTRQAKNAETELIRRADRDVSIAARLVEGNSVYSSFGRD